MFRGEDVVGSVPTAVLETVRTGWNIQNPYAQEDDPDTRILNQTELWGHSVAPIGDYGA